MLSPSFLVLLLGTNSLAFLDPLVDVTHDMLSNTSFGFLLKYFGLRSRLINPRSMPSSIIISQAFWYSNLVLSLAYSASSQQDLVSKKDVPHWRVCFSTTVQSVLVPSKLLVTSRSDRWVTTTTILVSSGLIILFLAIIFLDCTFYRLGCRKSRQYDEGWRTKFCSVSFDLFYASKLQIVPALAHSLVTRHLQILHHFI